MGGHPRIRQLSPEVGGVRNACGEVVQAAEVVDDFAADELESELGEDFSELEDFSDPEDFSALDDFSPLEAVAAAAALPLVRLSVA
jgi:hypothetical protein